MPALMILQKYSSTLLTDDSNLQSSVLMVRLHIGKLRKLMLVCKQKLEYPISVADHPTILIVIGSLCERLLSSIYVSEWLGRWAKYGSAMWRIISKK